MRCHYCNQVAELHDEPRLSPKARICEPCAKALEPTLKRFGERQS